MGKDNKGRELGKGLYQWKDGRYEARAKVNGKNIDIFGRNLRELKKRFEEEKELAVNRLEARINRLTLSEWFDEWFENYKVPYVKETSVFPMRSKFYNSFGKRLGDMRLVDITNIDVQNVITQMNKEGKAASTMREALGRMRECMESAKFLSPEEQSTFLKTVEHNWYKEMFYIIFLTGMRIGEVGSLMWSDIDFDNKCIHINRSLSCQYEYGKKMLRLTEPKTHNSYRKIPFFEEAEEMYLSQQKKVKELKKTLGSRWRGEEGEGAGFGLMM